MELDFLKKLNRYINSLGLFATSEISLLDVGESISVLALPGGVETIFFDGTRDKHYNVQIMAKSQDPVNSINALTTIYQRLENLESLESDNGSYEFQGITTTSLPNFVMMDEQGYVTYQITISAEITIYKGVEI